MAKNNKVVFDQLFKTKYVRNKLHSFSCGCSLLKNIPYYSRRGVTDRFTSSENAQLGCVSAWLEGFSRHVNPSGPAQVSFCDCLQGDRVHEARAGHLIKHPYDLKPEQNNKITSVLKRFSFSSNALLLGPVRCLASPWVGGNV